LIEKLGKKKKHNDRSSYVAAASKVVDALANHLRVNGSREVTPLEARETATRQLKELFADHGAGPIARSATSKGSKRRKRSKRK
jgi:hypothetical protein